MITVPQEWQLPQITQCCPGIGPLGEGVQKVVKGMEVVHVYEGVGKGKNDVPVCVGWKGVEVTGSTSWREMGLIASRSANTGVSLLFLIQVQMVTNLLLIVVCLHSNNALPQERRS